MKYECTQGQYVDFLNMLTATQASARFSGHVRIHRCRGSPSMIRAPAPELYVTTTPERGCGTIALPDARVCRLDGVAAHERTGV